MRHAYTYTRTYINTYVVHNSRAFVQAPMNTSHEIILIVVKTLMRIATIPFLFNCINKYYKKKFRNRRPCKKFIIRRRQITLLNVT